MRTHLVGHTYEGALMRTHYYEGNNEEASVTYIIISQRFTNYIHLDKSTF